MNTVALLILVASTTIISTIVLREANACEVLSLPSIDESIDDSSAIFSGTVKEFRTISAHDGMQDMRAALLEVDRYWKNPDDVDYNKERVVFTAIDNGACGFDFEEGKSYLVYAWSQDNGSLYTSIGTRTAPLENAQDDLAALGRGTVPAEQGNWQEQLEARSSQPKQNEATVETNSAILLVGSGAAVAGLVAFFSLRWLKCKEKSEA